jgi:Purple acid Phosphatase, N-terminal domain/Calcineurin-like phosphoesterase
MSESSTDGSYGKATFTRRRFIIGTVGVSAVAALGGTVVRAPRAFAATPPSGPPTTTLPLPTTTDPEQLLLTWGRDPATDVTVSWSAPGTVAQPAPVLSFSTQPISAHNPGWLVKLPDPRPLDVTGRYGEATAISFTDGLNGQTTYFYHVQLTGLKPGTRYYYQVSDGAATPSTAGSSFETAPTGRAKFRFSSYGDLATPSWDLNTSGNIWHESCDNSWYAVTAIENPGDGKGAPLFHLLNGDLCYANLDVNNAPGVWRDFGNNVARSAANRPWMPALGNHECEFGTDTIYGHPGSAPGGIAAQGAAGNYWNGPYGFGHYLSRFLLPDNGVTNWDGNRLRGNFYSFQVGTVKFISLDADDIIYQDGAANYVIDTANVKPEVTTTGASIPNGTTTYTRFYTGGLKPDAANNSLVPDYASGKPNLQTIWLEQTLKAARRDPSVDMIVVFMHQCAMSTSVPGNGSDLGIRQAWLPLFDQYEVDLVLSGHEHDYERTYPVRGYDAGEHGTVVAPNPGQTKGAAVDTRRPAVVTTEPYEFGGTPAWNTAEGTVYLVLGGGGTNGPTNTYGTDTTDDEPQAKVITTRNAVVGSEATGFVKDGADSVEDAPWSAAINPTTPTGTPSSTWTPARARARRPSPSSISRSRR